MQILIIELFLENYSAFSNHKILLLGLPVNLPCQHNLNMFNCFCTDDKNCWTWHIRNISI